MADGEDAAAARRRTAVAEYRKKLLNCWELESRVSTGFGTVDWVDVKEYEVLKPDKIATDGGEQNLKVLDSGLLHKQASIIVIYCFYSNACMPEESISLMEREESIGVTALHQILISTPWKTYCMKGRSHRNTGLAKWKKREQLTRPRMNLIMSATGGSVASNMFEWKLPDIPKKLCVLRPIHVIRQAVSFVGYLTYKKNYVFYDQYMLDQSIETQ